MDMQLELDVVQSVPVVQLSPCCSEKSLKGRSLQPEIYLLTLSAKAKVNPPNTPVSYLYGHFISNIRTFSYYSR